MSSLSDAVGDLRLYFTRQVEETMKLQEVDRIARGTAQRFVAEIHLKAIAQYDLQINETLHRLLNYPPHHSDRHGSYLEKFLEQNSYDKSVFIMTKYPDGKGPKDKALQKVIDLIVKAVEKQGYFPHLASDAQFEPQIWDNIELYMLGCSRGIALVEDRYMAEFNPNVALEWGWMRAMNKQVLILEVEGFSHQRADAAGFLVERFSWEKPAKGINAAIKKFLKDP